MQRNCVKCGASFDAYKCPACAKQWHMEYRAKNLELLKAKNRQWHKDNHERSIALHRQWLANNREKVKKDKEKWHASHPGARSIWQHNREARARESGGALSPGLAEKLFKLQRGKCPCCGLPLGDDYHLDHKMPIALGGLNKDWNMQLLRSACNNQKQAKHPVDFMQSRGFLL